MALLLAAALILAPALGAFAASGTPASRAGDPPPITWAVEPSTATGGTARASFAYSVKPGIQINDYIAISNFGKQSTTFNVYATDATNDYDSGAFGLLPANKKPSDVGAWITPAVKSMEVAPGKRAIVPFSLVVPSDATPGDHTAGIIASYISKSTNAKGEAIQVEQRVAARVYLRVAGTVAAKVATTGLVAGFSPSWNPFSGGTGSLDYAVSNSGNVRMDVKQDIVFTGPFGIRLGSIHPDPVVNILPGQAVHVHAETTGIAPLLFLWGAVNLKPGAPTDTVAESKEQGANGAPARGEIAGEVRRRLLDRTHRSRLVDPADHRDRAGRAHLADGALHPHDTGELLRCRRRRDRRGP